MRFATGLGAGTKVPTRRRHPSRPPTLVLVVLCCALAVASCTGDGSNPRLQGTTVEVVAVWQGAEAAAFRRVLDGFEEQTGAEVRYTSTEGEDIAAVLDRRLASGDPPDIAVLPQPGLLAAYAERGAVLPIDEVVGDEVRRHYSPEWRRLGTVGGRLYGVWFKAANKSLVWYSIGAFERAGMIPPTELDGLAAVAAAVTASGTPAFATTNDPADAWTLTDLFENLYLRIAGPSRYDSLAAHRIPWTDPSVVDTLEVMSSLLQPSQRAVLPAGAGLAESVAAVFSPSPVAAMVVEGDFVPGVVADAEGQAGSDEPAGEVGIDVDVFAFPEARSGDRFVVGGGDAAALMRAGRGAEELLRYLATPEAAEIWARQGGFLSPNEGVDLAAYPDATTRRIARSLLDAGGGGFRFDLSDLQPVAFGGTTGAGMWAVLAEVVADPSDLPAAAARLEAAADAAWRAQQRQRSIR